MSASDHLSQQQFANSLHEVPITPMGRIGTDEAAVRHVPTHLLHGAFSFEYETPAHQMEQARAEKIAQYGVEHPRDEPGQQEALERSVAQHGVQKPLVINYTPPNPHMSGSQGEWGIIDGSHRLLAAMRTKQSHVPVVQRF